jgi:CheY-like chemotaxis protein
MYPALRLVANGLPPSDTGGDRAPAAKSGNGKERKPTLLVVEDEVLIRLSVAESLRESGYRILEASNADEAQSIFTAGEPVEVVFSDVNMPGEMSGFDLAHWIKQEFPDVKVLLTSGATPASGENTFDGPFLSKPYSHHVLLAQIKRLLMG